MSVNPKTLVEKLIKDSKGRNRLAAATSVLALFTVLITVGALTFPAISLSGSEEALQEQGININPETGESIAPPEDEDPTLALDGATTDGAENVAEPIVEATYVEDADSDEPAISASGEDGESAAAPAEGEDTEAAPEPTPEEQEAIDAVEDEGIEVSDAAKAALAGADLSSARLIVGAAEHADAQAALGEEEAVVAEHDGLYLLQYADEKTAAEGFLRYFDTSAFITPDTALAIAEGETNADPEEDIITTDNVYTEEENPFAQLEAAIVDAEDEIKAEAAKQDALIALIDTGADTGDNVVEAVSVLGDDAADDNGHGKRMVGYITEQNDAARILSIKALGKDGKGDVSAVIAAINYAVERGANIVNLSVSAYASEENAALADAIKSAQDAGLVVVGAAGNQGFNAKYYIPGNIEEATIVGSSDDAGVRIKQSNYGETVDYNVASGSTSEAAARMSGFISANGTDAIAAALNQGLIFETGYVAPAEEEEPEAEGGNTVEAQDTVTTWADLKSKLENKSFNGDITISGSLAADDTINIHSGYNGTISGGNIYRKANAKFGSMFKIPSGANVTFDSVDFDGRTASTSGPNLWNSNVTTKDDNGVKFIHIEGNAAHLALNSNGHLQGLGYDDLANSSVNKRIIYFDPANGGNGVLEAQDWNGENKLFLKADLTNSRGYVFDSGAKENGSVDGAYKWEYKNYNGANLFYNAATNSYINCDSNGGFAVKELPGEGAVSRPVSSGKGSTLTNASLEELKTKAYNNVDLGFSETSDPYNLGSQFGFFLDIQGTVTLNNANMHDVNIISRYYDNRATYKDYAKSVNTAYNDVVSQWQDYKKEDLGGVYNAAPIAVNGGTLNINSGYIHNNYVGYPMYDQAELSGRYNYDNIVTNPQGLALKDNSKKTNDLNGGNAHIMLGSADDHEKAHLYILNAASQNGQLKTGTAGGLIINGGVVNLNNGTIGMQGSSLDDGWSSTNKGTPDVRVDEDFNIADAGGVYIKGGGTLNQHGGKIINNVGYSAGGVYVQEGVYNLVDGELTKNVSWCYGGGATVTTTYDRSTNTSYFGELNMKGGVIAGNVTAHKGGGIFVASDHVNLEAGSIFGNTAYEFGGGVYVEGSSEGQYYVLSLDNADITENFAQHNGGGIWLCSTGSLIYSGEHVKVWNNKAEGYVSPNEDRSWRLAENARQGGNGQDIYKVYKTGILADFIPAAGTDKWQDETWGLSDKQYSDTSYDFIGTYNDVLLKNNASYSKSSSLQIYGNKAYEGGGVGNNGLLYFKFPRVSEDEVELFLNVEKKFVGEIATQPKLKAVVAITENDKTISEQEIYLNEGNNWRQTIKLPQTLAEVLKNNEEWKKAQSDRKTAEDRGSFIDGEWSFLDKYKIKITEFYEDGKEISSGYEMSLSNMLQTYADITINTMASDQTHVIKRLHRDVFQLFTTMTNTPIPEQKGSLTVTKVDDNGDLLPGVTLALYDNDKREGDALYTWNTADADANPKVIKDLAVGDYYIFETATPKGYVGLGENEYIEVKVEPAKVTTVNSGNNGSTAAGDPTKKDLWPTDVHLPNTTGGGFSNMKLGYRLGAGNIVYCLDQSESHNGNQVTEAVLLKEVDSSKNSSMSNVDKIVANNEAIGKIVWAGYPNNQEGLRDKLNELTAEKITDAQFEELTQDLIWYYTNGYNPTVNLVNDHGSLIAGKKAGFYCTWFNYALAFVAQIQWSWQAHFYIYWCPGSNQPLIDVEYPEYSVVVENKQKITTEYTVNKEWLDVDDNTVVPEKGSDKTVEITLYRTTDGTETIDDFHKVPVDAIVPTNPITLPIAGSDNPWSYTFENLPIKDEDGKVYRYYASETSKPETHYLAGSNTTTGDPVVIPGTKVDIKDTNTALEGTTLGPNWHTTTQLVDGGEYVFVVTDNRATAYKDSALAVKNSYVQFEPVNAAEVANVSRACKWMTIEATDGFKLFNVSSGKYIGERDGYGFVQLTEDGNKAHVFQISGSSLYSPKYGYLYSNGERFNYGTNESTNSRLTIYTNVVDPSNPGDGSQEPGDGEGSDDTTIDQSTYIPSYTTTFTNRELGVKVSILKVGSDGKRGLAGAVLQLVDEEGEVVDQWTTEEGKAYQITKSLTAGDYILHELSAPQGYTKAPDKTITITADDLKVGKEIPVEMVDAKETDIVILKVDDDGKPVGGAVLQLYKLDNKKEQLIREWTTSIEEGKTGETFKLTAGIYVVRETKTPDGYITANEIRFEVPEDGSMPEEKRYISVEDTRKTVNLIINKKWIGKDNKPADPIYKGVPISSVTFDIWQIGSDGNRTTADPYKTIEVNADNEWIATETGLPAVASNGPLTYEVVEPEGTTHEAYKLISPIVKSEPTEENNVISYTFTATNKVTPTEYDLTLVKFDNASNVGNDIAAGENNLDAITGRNNIKEGTNESSLNGAQFTLHRVTAEGKQEYLQEDWTWDSNPHPFTVAGQGTVTFEKLPAPGTYVLTEIKEPEAYEPANGKFWTFEINDKGEVTQKTKAGTSELVVGKDNTFGVVGVGNQLATYTLPSTGGEGTRAFAIIGGLLMVAAGVLYVRRARRAPASHKM